MKMKKTSIMLSFPSLALQPSSSADPLPTSLCTTNIHFLDSNQIVAKAVVDLSGLLSASCDCVFVCDGVSRTKRKI